MGNSNFPCINGKLIERNAQITKTMFEEDGDWRKRRRNSTPLEEGNCKNSLMKRQKCTFWYLPSQMYEFVVRYRSARNTEKRVLESSFRLEGRFMGSSAKV